MGKGLAGVITVRLLSWETVLGYPGGPANSGECLSEGGAGGDLLVQERAGEGGPQQRQPGGAEPQALQGEAAAPGAGMAGNRCLPAAPEGAQPTKHLGFSPVELISGFPLPHGRE